MKSTLRRVRLGSSEGVVTVWVDEVADSALWAERVEAREDDERVEDAEDHFCAFNAEAEV